MQAVRNVYFDRMVNWKFDSETIERVNLVCGRRRINRAVWAACRFGSTLIVPLDSVLYLSSLPKFL